MRSVLALAAVLAVGCGGSEPFEFAQPNYAGDWRVAASGRTEQHFTMRLFQAAEGEYHGRMTDNSGERFVILRTGGPYPAFCVMPASKTECDYGYALSLDEELDVPLTLVGHAPRWEGHDFAGYEVVRLELTHL